MARTAVTVVTLSGTVETADPAGTTADPTNDHVVSDVPLEELVLRIANTNGSDRVATIVAGDSPPAFAAGQGSLAITVAATSGVEWIGPFDSSRFAQSDGSLHIDLATSFAGTVTAFRIPRTA